ncbi:hypothetical protein ACFWZ2_11275 [Streptomyces sp. NPDC059002]|uniref:hypothetical protein n=1 Tax=Streptomyces sp. NPDC059002 TaxID=3346690 RepID=UPI0036B463E6
MSTAPPAPSATDAAAFMAALRRLKAWSGLSYRQLERRAAAAGHVLPFSTAATMLGKDRLPREALVVAFVAACGLRGEHAEAWVDARGSIVCAPAPAPEPAPARRVRTRRPRLAWVAAVALVAALLGGAAAGGAFTDEQEVRQTQTSYEAATTGG